MKQYSIRPLCAPLPELTGMVFVPDEEPFCQAHDAARIDSYVWEGDYRPEARAYVAWDGNGLSVLLCAKEETICTAAKHFCDPVCRDSCLEFFLMPLEDDPRYVNIEVNAAGVAYIGKGTGRADGKRLDALPEGMNIRTSRHEGGWWAVAYTVPFALIERLLGRTPGPGEQMRGNFYKCDETVHPHFGSWSPVVSPKPDFHRPECFGTLEFVDRV